MATSQEETKKLNGSLTANAIRGELNKLKIPSATPPEKELQPARKKKNVYLPKDQVERSSRVKLMEDFPILKEESMLL